MDQGISSLFTWIDYLVLGLMLGLSSAIGIYYACVSNKHGNNTEEFLMAGRSMTTFPIAMSLISSFISAITLLGTPSEVYQFGFLYWLIAFAYSLMIPATCYLYLPVFWNMQVTSAYEYLGKRFQPYCRRIGSAVFIIQMVLYMGIVVYAPALALSQVTGIDLLLSTCLICFVCMFYTTIGGMKAVVWTDTLQVIVMYSVIIFIAIYGTLKVGGLEYVWRKAVESERAEFIKWDPNPTTRHTVWTLIVGGTFSWLPIYGCNQAQVQRYMCVQKLSMARRALWINLIGLISMMLMTSFIGLIIYAKYADCDPIRSGVVQAGDQLFPLFVLETMGHLKGLPGLFVAGVFSGTLSTVSTGMNSLAAIVLEDFIKGVWFPDLSEKTSTLLCKIFSLLFGLLAFGLVFLAQIIGNVLSAAFTVTGIVGGPLLGMFTLGMFFPWSNALGCAVGTVLSLCFMFFIGFGSQVANGLGYTELPRKSTSIAGCDFQFNETLTTASPPAGFSMWSSSIFKLSYLWYGAGGFVLTVVIGLAVSCLTGKQNIRSLNPDMLSPGFHWIKSYIPGMEQLGIDSKSSDSDADRIKSNSTEMKVNGVINRAFNNEEKISTI